jgi:hypothetical protein
VPVKELLESLKKDKEALLDAFNQLHFLSQRQREVVAHGDADCIDLFIKDKAESLGIIDKISLQIKKKVKQIRVEGAASDKSSAEKFALSLDKECQGIISKIAGIESADKDFINKTRELLGKEMKDVDDVKGNLRSIKKGYTSADSLSHFDKQG